MAPLRIASSLLPYALAAAAVVVASVVALGMTVRPIAVETGPGLATREPAAASRAPVTLDARMAYWRTGADGLWELWASDITGDRRTRIDRQGRDTVVANTRIAPDGSAVAYTAQATQIEVARFDLTHATIQLPSELRRARWRIASFQWSPDGKRIAATFRAGAGLGSESDVWVAETKSTADWQRATTLGDAHAGPWIDDDRLFIESASGLIATLDLGTNELRPITGMPAASPRIGRDGRVYFTGGISATADLGSAPAAAGWVWSATLDGHDLRREADAELGQARVSGMLADGRAVVGVPGSMFVASDSIVPLAFAGVGNVRRVVVSDDGRRVVGIGDSRILRIDPTKIPRTAAPGALLPASAATVLLSGIHDPDVWTAPTPVALATGTPLRTDVPPGFAFALGHAIWEMQRDGSARALATERGAFIGRPEWSPRGDRVAVMFTATGEREPSVLVTGADGPVRWRLPIGAQSLAWSPDGSTITFWIPTGTRLDRWDTHSFDATTGRAGATLPGRAVWGGGGRLVIGDGEFELATGTAASTGIRVGQTLDLITPAARRTITDARRVASSPLLKDVPDATRPPIITNVMPSPDPRYVAVMLGRLAPTQVFVTRTPALVVIRVSDGEPVYARPIRVEAGPHDLAWSPPGGLLAWGVNEPAAPGERVTRRATVVDPVAGTERTFDGVRFAGWSADGTWIYLARDDGLYALEHAAAASDAVRISPLGVVVSTARGDAPPRSPAGP